MTRYVVYDTERHLYLARFNGNEPVWTGVKTAARVWRYADSAHMALNRVKLRMPNNENLVVTEQ